MPLAWSTWSLMVESAGFVGRGIVPPLVAAAGDDCPAVPSSVRLCGLEEPGGVEGREVDAARVVDLDVGRIDRHRQ